MQAVSHKRQYAPVSGTGTTSGLGARYDGTAALQYESVAYDLTRFDQRRKVRSAVSADESARVSSRTENAAKTAAAVRPSVFSVMSFLVIMGLLFMIVYSYMQISMLNETKNEMQNQISDLEQEHAAMLAGYEQKISLSELEEKAINEFGMVKADQEQVQYIDLSGSDYAVVLAPEKQDTSAFMSAVSSMFQHIMEYIR